MSKNSTILLVLIIIASLFLCLPLITGDLAWWPRLLCISLLCVGFFGNELNSRITRAAGWVGIGFFLFLSILIWIPGEDEIMGENGPIVQDWYQVHMGNLVLRESLLVILTTLMAWRFYRGRPSPG